jgi:2-haloacid dehalogenase
VAQCLRALSYDLDNSMGEPTTEALRAHLKVCMFDQYGTLVDMQKGLTEVVTPYLKAKGWDGRPDAFVTW